MKKIIFLFGLVFLTYSVFAQESWEYNRRNAVTLNPGAFIVGTLAEGFGIGIAYERSFSSQFSAKANMYFLGYEAGKGYNQAESRVDGYTVTGMLALEGRWYPMARFLEGIFLNAGLQYHLLAGTVAFYDYSIGRDRQFNQASSTLGFYTGVGYKVVFGKSRFGLALEPTIDYIWSFYSNIPYSYRDDVLDHSSLSMTAMGVKGVRIGLQVGVAF
jgi:hypothetical protein